MPSPARCSPSSGRAALNGANCAAGAARPREERYYLDDPEDMERLRQSDARAGPRSRRRRSTTIEDYSREDRSRLGAGQAVPRGAASRLSRRAGDHRARADRTRAARRQPRESEPEPPAARRQRHRSPSRRSISARARMSPRCRCCSTARARRRASSTASSARMSTRRSPPIATITGENLNSTDTEGIKKALAASGGDPFTELHDHGRRMRPAPCRLGAGGLRREGQARPAELHLGSRDARRALPHGRKLSEGAQSGGQFRPRRAP